LASLQLAHNVDDTITDRVAAVSAYRPPSACKTSETTDLLKHDTSLVVCFSVTNVASFVQKLWLKLGPMLTIELAAAAAHQPLVLMLSRISYVWNADSGR